MVVAFLIVGVFGFFPKGSVQAEAYTSYVSGITMVNLSTLQASVTIEYYRGGTGSDAGQLATSTTILVNGGAVQDYAAVPVSNFKGAVVISSSQPIAAMSTLTGGSMGRGSYVGAGSGSKTVLLPFLAKNHGSSKWNTFVAVQNIGQSDTVVNVDYAGCAAPVDATSTVKPGSSVIFDQATTACLGSGLTSAVITSTVENILAVVDQESTTTNTALVSSGFAAGTTNPVIPLVNANNPNVSGWRTAITIMNVGSADSAVTLTYMRTDGTSCTETQTIQMQKSKVFAGATLQLTTPPAGVVTTCAAQAKLVGAAYVTGNTASVPLVAIVNQDRTGLASAYGSFDPTQGTARVVMPLIMDNNGSGQWGTSFNVMNVHPSATAFVKCTFANSAYVATSPSAGLPPNGVFEDLQRTKLGLKLTSAECKTYTDNTYSLVDNGGKIVAVVNERALAASGDGMLTYEAVNTQP